MIWVDRSGLKTEEAGRETKSRDDTVAPCKSESEHTTSRQVVSRILCNLNTFQLENVSILLL